MSDHHLGIPALAIASVVLLNVLPVSAGLDEERACQRARHRAAAKYAQCELKAIANAFDVEDESFGIKYMTPLATCAAKYGRTWAKLQAKASGTGSSCDQARFTAGSGTVQDHLTGLQWEQKTDDGSAHDWDGVYTWSALAGSSDADGTVFTDFLATLNGTCFASHCDWRLPTRAELHTILAEAYPCTTSPCIDQALFGPTKAAGYPTSTPEATNPFSVWFVSFHDGYVNNGFNDALYPVRAVRGGW